MKETQRISRLFSNLYNGSPWIDVEILNTLDTITPEIAVKKLKPETNSIWEIANHLIAWRENVLERVKGKVITTPIYNYILPVAVASETAWQELLQRLEQSQRHWISFLEDFDEKDFDTTYPNNGMNYYEHIHGIIQHDCYHLGQIVLLTKLLS